MAARVTYRRKNTYRTKSNQVRKFRTPGGKLQIQYRNKDIKSLVCAETGKQLNGIPRVASFKLPKRQRTVSRAYGGVFSAAEVKRRITRAFLNEEIKGIKAEAQRAKKHGKKNKKK
jgi:large subunit ribosomal protein L34e